MNINKLFKSNYLKAADLDEDLTTMVIDRVEVADLDSGGRPGRYQPSRNRAPIGSRQPAARAASNRNRT